MVLMGSKLCGRKSQLSRGVSTKYLDNALAATPGPRGVAGAGSATLSTPLPDTKLDQAGPQVAHYLVRHFPGACKIRGGQRNGRNLGVAATPIALADAGKIGGLGCCVPWVAAHTNLDSRLRAL